MSPAISPEFQSSGCCGRRTGCGSTSSRMSTARVEAPFDIALDEIDGGVLPGDSVVVAARAVVEGEGADGTHPRCLLGDKCVAWGEGSRFRPRLPAMYFTYEVQEAFLCGGERPSASSSPAPPTTAILAVSPARTRFARLGRSAPGSLAAPGTYKAWLSDSVASRRAPASPRRPFLTSGSTARRSRTIGRIWLAVRTTRVASGADIRDRGWGDGSSVYPRLDGDRRRTGTPVSPQFFGDCAGWTSAPSEQRDGVTGSSHLVHVGWSATAGAACSIAGPTSVIVFSSDPVACSSGLRAVCGCVVSRA